MARARNIKPAFFTNDHLADVHPLGRLLFIGLWTVADREGRLEDRPRRIKAEVLPYDDVDCDTLLNQLAEHGFILRYSVDSKRFIQVLKFNKHQNPHMKEAASSIPAPDLTGASTVKEPVKNETSPADSLNPLTDSLNPLTESSDSDESAKSVTESDSSSVNDRFTEFWSVYPKKVGKGDAEAKFKKIRWSEVSFSDLMASLKRQKASEQWQADGGRFVPNPATWIYQKRWGDELQPPTGKRSGSSITEPNGYSHDPDEAEKQMKRQLAEMQRKALGGAEGQIIPIRREA